MDQLNTLNAYREAEVRGAELLQRLLRDCVDPQMTMYFTHQLAAEARHIQLLTDLLSELGGTPTVIHVREAGQENKPFVLATELLLRNSPSAAQPGGEAYGCDVFCWIHTGEPFDHDRSWIL